MRKKKLLAIVGILFGAPVCAEYLQAYLPFTGDAAWFFIGLLFFAPLYGGAALLIREAAVRTDRGWVGILLLAGAFGVLMPGLIDLAMLGEHRSDIPYWEDLRRPTLVPGLGLSVFPLSGWVLGHVVMSVGTPLALLGGLAPSLRGRPLLRWWGILLLSILFLLIALAVHMDGQETYGYAPGAAQTLSVAAVAMGLVIAAFSPLGQPVSQSRQGWVPGFGLAFAAGAIGMLGDGLLPNTWVGVAVRCAMFVVMVGALVWLSRSRGWGAPQITGLACGALVQGAFIGFLVPVPEGAGAVGKYVQNAVQFSAALGLSAIAWRIARYTDNREG